MAAKYFKILFTSSLPQSFKMYTFAFSVANLLSQGRLPHLCYTLEWRCWLQHQHSALPPPQSFSPCLSTHPPSLPFLQPPLPSPSISSYLGLPSWLPCLLSILYRSVYIDWGMMARVVAEGLIP